MDNLLNEVRVKLRYLPKISQLLEMQWEKEARSFWFLTLAVRQWPIGEAAEKCPALATMGAYHLTLEQKLYGMFYYIHQIKSILREYSHREHKNGELVLQFKNKMTEQFFLEIECYLYPFFYVCSGVLDILAHEINLLFVDPPITNEKEIYFSSEKLLRRLKNHRPDIYNTVKSIRDNPSFKELKCYRNRSTHRTLISFSPYHVWNRKNGQLQLQLKDVLVSSPNRLKEPTWKVLLGEKVPEEKVVDKKVSYSNRVVMLLPYLDNCQDYIVSSVNDITRHIFEKLQSKPFWFKEIDKYLSKVSDQLQ